MHLVARTLYFRLLVKRSYIKREWCLRAIQEPVKKEIQTDGRVRHWIYIAELSKYLRVVTLEDGETIHNAFPDRNFKTQ
ncbi:MAG: hypothetical protein HC764_27095 [Pleurocapsa sp. CRU_1_2]|nr:hypothetical protein [Pleurocapsa sp. CRU_1_2]